MNDMKNIDWEQRPVAEYLVPPSMCQRHNKDHGDQLAHFEFLSDLRDSGTTNMFGAAPILADAFGMDKKEAGEILADWISFWVRLGNQHFKEWPDD